MSPSARGIAASAVVAALCAALLGWLDLATRAAVERGRDAALLARIEELLPGARYDNDPAADHIELPDDLRSGRIYRARFQGQPVGAILQATASGYSGDIVLLIGIHADGRLGGVRVLAQRETRGFGDRIEATRSGWLRSLAGWKLQRDWRMKADRGEIDQLSGATITSRAVVKTLQQALDFHQQQHSAIYAPMPGATS